MMNTETNATFIDTPTASMRFPPPRDGIVQLPPAPGIYAVFNLVNRLIYIGQSVNVQKRCNGHRQGMRAGTEENMRLRLDAIRFGVDAFVCFPLELLVGVTAQGIRHHLNRREIWWVRRMRADDEQYGYVAEAGRCRSPASQFRDRERKLMRGNSRKYQLLPWVNVYDPI